MEENFWLHKKTVVLKKAFSEDFKLFGILFLISIFIYGGKLFFYSLAPDDYSRFYSGGSEQASWLGRWMAGIISQHVFTHSLQVLPYINGLLGVFAFTLSAFLTGKFFSITNKLILSIVTLLITISPFVTHSFFFNISVSAWLSILFGLIGFFLAYNKHIIIKFLGLTLLVIAIGIYQTIIQVILIIIVVKAILDILSIKELEELKKIAKELILGVGFVFLAFVFSVTINNLYIDFNHLHMRARYAKSGNIHSLSYYLKQVELMYEITVKGLFGLKYFKDELVLLYNITTLLTFFSVIFFFIRKKATYVTKAILMFIALFLLAVTPIILNLPLIMGNSVPARAYIAGTWMVAGLFIIQIKLLNGILRAISFAVAIFIIIVSAFYVNVFFHAAYRQTMSDITRANQIVTTIRNNPNYNSEPMQFKIVGEKSFAVKGWKLDYEALNTNWSKYGLFSNFTDFKYKGMSEESYDEVTRELIERGEIIKPYPAKNSIYVSGDKAVLYLNPIKINTAIKLEHFQEEKADINAYFDLYVRGKNIYYKKTPCTKSDIAHTFFLHVYPTKKSVLPQKLQKRGILYMDFRFSQFGKREGNSCIAVKELPSFDIEKIATGQYAHGKIDWSKVYSFKK